MKNTLKFSTLALASLCIFAACEKPDAKQDPTADNGTLVLCEGSMNKNNSTLTLVGSEGSSSFESVNGYALGDTAQDVIQLADGSLCIAVTNSKRIYFTDKKLKVSKTVEPMADGAACSPRSLVEKDGIVYASLYEGYFCKISKDGSCQSIKVGPNPEGVAIRGNYAYVANSGGYVEGYNNTVSVIDLKTFSESATIKVGTNPVNMVCIDGKVFVQYAGNYTTVMAGVDCIASDNSVSSIEALSGANDLDAGAGNTLLCMTVSYAADWSAVGNVLEYNPSTKATKTLAAELANAYSITGSASGFYLGISDYVTMGTIREYGKDGASKGEFSAEGMNPRKVLKIR